ncbi:hypothetical protein CQ040_15705 [Microbacterium sp. MYb54]|nr:hypothetical protein CQ032_15055 [Microbacterium sp. MYb43]PQZ75136.1 hypothetical protein CQ031_14410 [Microbacterium sp. MYb40]PRB19431.1 hypothetical protein CQ040_15705 [Microbacterium sp. MYb54]PRB24632.1 hypothetical protein CQ037_16210 [Microbacterium sp. MYb50]PRB63743.1 hypothetical protein CQ021_15815 [Microbacterium sp. MYb24]PRB66133.1 hypothetical protein CQ027_19575 [Microbacterium sp. MYb32]
MSIPAKVETPLGVFEFFDGMPLPDTIDRAWDSLDLMRAVDVFLNAMPGASMVAMRKGFRSIGGDANHKLIYTDPKADSAQIVLTANTVTAYGTNFIDLSVGPVVVEVPPNSLSFVDDIWQRYVSDMGNAGEDRGVGGKYLFVPPGFDGEVPDGYYVRRSLTFSNWLVIRALGGVDDLLTTRIYSLADAATPPEMEFINMAGASFIGVHANDGSFYEEIDTIVQEEPVGCLDPERAGQIAALGIMKGRPFAPDERMRSILDAGARIGGGIARTITYKPRDPAFYYYPDASWTTAFVGGSSEFLADGVRLLDARSVMQYIGTGITPAMAVARVGIGSQYVNAFVDSTGQWLDGSKHYTLRLPAEIPAKTFWSIDIYDPQTRSLLQTSNPWPSINSFHGDVPAEADGGTVIHFSPQRGDGQDNWLETVPGKGWFVILRLYGPLEPWFDKTWRPGEIEMVG